ncbi:pentatricopeptide repeat-containing protein [Quercus suber]|uniref:Pentatricopeptide repeat-containing protein n=1 Tax=Quercus suber TaxID=58331 RepID=A0AAW0K640_QUESU
MPCIYGISPQLEHHSCMVDLFGRAGLLHKAKDIIKTIPYRPTPAMWATLIGACQIYGNTELGEWATEKLLEMRPENSGYYVSIANMYAADGHWNMVAKSNSCHVGYTNRSLLDLWKYRIRGVRKCEKLLEMRPENSGYYVSIANMYAADGHWNMVAKVRTSMRDLGVRKAPGSTWIDMGLGFLPFMAGDTSNPHAEEIYTLLDGLNELMKDAGYVASGDLGLEVNFVEYDEQ